MKAPLSLVADPLSPRPADKTATALSRAGLAARLLAFDARYLADGLPAFSGASASATLADGACTDAAALWAALTQSPIAREARPPHIPGVFRCR